MDLLLQSKRAWLLSFLFFCGIDLLIYNFWLDKDWLHTVFFLISIMLGEMIIFFLLIVLFKWTKWTRRFIAAIYLGITIYAWIKGYIGRWYVIIPTFLFMCFFMLWNIGGVKNCIVSSPYKSKLSFLEYAINGQYEAYSHGLDRFNWRNGFNFFTKVRKKWKPFMWLFRFEASALDMFDLEDAIFGVDTTWWELSINRLNRKSGRLSEKLDAIRLDESISEEHSRFNSIIQTRKKMNLYNSNDAAISSEIDNAKRIGLKREKKILKRRL